MALCAGERGAVFSELRYTRATPSYGRAYFVDLRKGRKISTGYEKMAAIAKAMGFPPEAWFEDGNLPALDSEPWAC